MSGVPYVFSVSSILESKLESKLDAQCEGGLSSGGNRAGDIITPESAPEMNE